MEKLLKETNPACVEKILQCFKVWVNKKKVWEELEIKCVIENGFINGKGNAKTLAVEIIDDMYDSYPDNVELGLSSGL